MRKFFNDIKENVSKQDISKKYSIEQFYGFRKKGRPTYNGYTGTFCIFKWFLNAFQLVIQIKVTIIKLMVGKSCKFDQI